MPHLIFAFHSYVDEFAAFSRKLALCPQVGIAFAFAEDAAAEVMSSSRHGDPDENCCKQLGAAS
jgi:hypothetical protein